MGNTSGPSSAARESRAFHQAPLPDGDATLDAIYSDIMDVPQLAAFLRKSEHAIYRLRHKGWPIWQCGRTLRARRSEIIEHIRQLERKQQPA